MNMYYESSAPEPVSYQSKKVYSVEDFEKLRNNYYAELEALRKRYLDKMIKCASNIQFN